MRYIHSPTELSLPGLWRGQTARINHFPTELSWLVTCVIFYLGNEAFSQLSDIPLNQNVSPTDSCSTSDTELGLLTKGLCFTLP